MVRSRRRACGSSSISNATGEGFFCVTCVDLNISERVALMPLEAPVTTATLPASLFVRVDITFATRAFVGGLIWLAEAFKPRLPFACQAAALPVHARLEANDRDP